MQFEYDPEQLILEVSKRPGIWNNEHANYRAKNIKAKLWHEVVIELMSINDVNMSKSEMRELELQLQKKWKSLRDCFQKYLANPFKFKRPYIYSKQLQFLLKDKKLPVQRNRATVTALDFGAGSESEDEESKPKNVWVSKKKIRLQKTEEESDNNDDTITDDYVIENVETRFSTEGPSQLAFANVNSQISKTHSEGHNQFAFANVDPQLSRTDTEDSDRMFLMSLLPHLRSIPEEFRLNVKLDLMQVLRVANESTAKLRYPTNPSCLDLAE